MYGNGSGNAILAAAVIDDVLGIICLTIVSGMADSSVKIGTVLFKSFYSLSLL